MKNIILNFAATLACVSASHSALALTPPMPHPVPEIADCWIESGMDIEDGEFIVNVDTSKLTKKELLTLMNMLTSRNIQPVAYPLIFDTSMFITVKAVDEGFGASALTRQQLKSEVEQQLRAALMYGTHKADFGTSAACNHRAYPAPAVGVRN